MADYKTPQWLLPNEKNLAYPAAGDGITGSGLSEDRHSLYSMDFDGTSYIDLGTGLDIFKYNVNESYTVSLWYKSTTSTSFDTIVNFGSNTYRFSLVTGLNGTISFGAGNSTSISYINKWLPTAGAINDGNWHHICIVQDSSGGIVNLTPYVDGSGSGSSPSSTAANVSSNNRIGNGYYSGFDGKLDEVAIYNKALNQSEINALSTASAPANLMALSAKPYAYYPLGEQAQMGYSNWNFPNGSLQSHVVDFNGTSEVIDINSTIDLGTVHTISFWVNVSATSFANITTGTGGSAIKLNAPNKIYYYTNNYTNSQPSISMPLNQWNNVVIARNGGTIKFYVNNSLLHTTSGFGGDGFTFNKMLGLDVNNKLSNLAVWDSDQSTNLTNIYNNGSPQSTYTVTPNNWWQLNAANSSYNTATSTWTFTDSSGTNDGTSTTLPSTALVASDLQFESSYSNYSLSFDGVDDYIDVGNLQPSTTSLSISAWAYKTDTSQASIIGRGASADYGIFVFGGSLQFGLNTGSWSTITTSIPTVNTWFHVCATWDGSNMKLYVDGVLASTASKTGTITYTSNNTTIGKNSTLSGFEWDGKIDEVALWGSALTQAQINQIYNNGYPADLTSLSPSNWWRLGEDAFFVSNVVTIPNKITGGASGTGGGGDQSAFLVGDAPGSYANGLGSSLVVTDRIGDAPESTANSVSINMIPNNRHSYPAGYAPTQVDNVYSMEFDGINDYIQLASSGALDTFHANPFSISFWFKYTGGTRILVTKRETASTSTRVVYIYTNAGDIMWYGGGVSPTVTSSGGLSDGNWHHAVFVAESDTVARIYIDGVDDTADTAKDRIGTGSNTAPIILGTTYNQSGFFFNGSMDEFAVFDYALSAKQIKQDIYNGTTTGKTADLNNISNLTAPVAWYRMGD